MFGTSFGNSASSGGAFAPSDITGLKLWLDADAANVNTEAAADFNGTNQYLSSASTAFDKGDESFSWGGWCYIDVSQSKNFFGKFNATGNNRSYDIWADESGTGFFRVVISSNGASGGGTTVLTDNTAISVGNWYYVVAVHDAPNNLIKVSVNGNAFVSSSHNGGAYSLSTSDLEIGGNNGNFFDGKGDLAFFYDKALSISEVTALYNSGNAIAYDSLSAAQKTDLVSWWSLSETSGTRYDQARTSANNLTDNNSVGWAAGILDEPVVNDSPVSRWLNKGTGTLNGTQSTAIAQPIWKSSGFGTNSKPYLTFDGDNNFFTLEKEYSKLPNHTIFVVCEIDSTADRLGISGDINSGGQTPSVGSLFEFNSSNLRAFYGDGSSLTNTQSSETFATGTNYIVSTNFSSGTVGEILRSNGSDLTETITGTADTISGTKSNFSIGRWGDIDGLYFNGKIAEYLLFSVSLSVTDTERIETYLNTKYAAYSPPGVFMTATGGTITTDGDYKVHSFSSSANFTVTSLGSDPTYGSSVEYLIVAGGGGGGGGVSGIGAGGGGAGGFITGNSAISAITYAIIVGSGGAAGYSSNRGSVGIDSSGIGLNAIGGGGGGYYNGGTNSNGLSGGSGGGGSPNQSPTIPGVGGTGTQNNDGGNAVVHGDPHMGGGGGGAGAVGNNASTLPVAANAGYGGDGLSSSIVLSSAAVNYAGGGGGGVWNESYPSSGGIGGGGAGANQKTDPSGYSATAGTLNTGGGGGGGTSGANLAASGGSGIVIFRYKFQ